MEKAYEIMLELFGRHIRETSIRYVASDIDTMPLLIKLVAKGCVFSLPESASVELEFQNSNGTVYLQDAVIISHEEGRVLYEVQPGDIFVPGMVTVSLTVADGSRRLTWQRFNFESVGTLEGEHSEPPDPPPSWRNQITERLSEQEEVLEKLSDTISEITTNGGKYLASHEDICQLAM